MNTLISYIPMDRRQALSKGETLPDRTAGTALFADISGFTLLTHAFVATLGDKYGAEAVLDHANRVYEALIGTLHHYGGSVIGFAGDAITCWFDDSEDNSAARTVACGLAMQAATKPVAAVTVPDGPTVELAFKIAIASGPARRFLVGDPSIRLIDTLAGGTLERMSLAEKGARQGEIVVSAEVAERLAAALRVDTWRQAESGMRFAVVAGLDRSVPPRPWPRLAEGTLAEDAVRPYVLPAIYEAVREGSAIVGDLRPVTPLFLSFGGIDFDGDDAAGEKLDRFIRWVQRTVDRHGGSLIQLTIGDKGAYIYVAFGAPVAHEDDPTRALQAAQALRTPPPKLDFITSVQIGMSRGEVRTGVCGSTARYVYSVTGNEVNLAPRLMAAAQPGQIIISGAISKTPYGANTSSEPF